MTPLSTSSGENPGLGWVFNAHLAPALVKIQAWAGFRVMHVQLAVVSLLLRRLRRLLLLLRWWRRLLSLLLRISEVRLGARRVFEKLARVGTSTVTTSGNGGHAPCACRNTSGPR